MINGITEILKENINTPPKEGKKNQKANHSSHYILKTYCVPAMLYSADTAASDRLQITSIPLKKKCK